MVTVMDMASGQLIAGKRDESGEYAEGPATALPTEWPRVECIALRLQEAASDRDAGLREAACRAAWLHTRG